MRICLLVVALTFSACHRPVLSPEPWRPPEALPRAEPIPGPILNLPPAPTLTKLGHDLVLEFETGGESGYNPRPEWPGEASGVTIGVGYDCGYVSRAVLYSDWYGHQTANLDRIAGTAGLTGRKAQARIRELQDILIGWQDALDVFDSVDVAREFAHARTALSGFDELRANAQAALISLGFNRGWGMSGPTRAEMRAIRDLAPQRDYGAMAQEIRGMIHIWRGTTIERGMTRRRQAEAQLMETP